MVELKNFIDLDIDEKREVLKWRNSDEVREWMYTKKIITLKEHLNFIESLKDKKDKKYFLVQQNSKNIGVINFTNITKMSLYIGLFANPDLKGVGKVLMQKILQIPNKKDLYAEVFKDNKKAIRLYKNFGFKLIKIKDKILTMELKNENLHHC